MYGYEEESFSDSLSDSQWRSAAVQQWAADRGQLRPDLAWIISPFDTWEPNPFYVGPRQPHPDDDCDYIPLTFQQALTIAKALARANDRPVRIERDRDGFITVME